MKSRFLLLFALFCTLASATLTANVTIDTSTGYTTQSLPQKIEPTITATANGYIVDYTIPMVSVSESSLPPILSQTFSIPPVEYQLAEKTGTAGLHIGSQSGVYVITLLVNGAPYDYKRILIPNNF